MCILEISIRAKEDMEARIDQNLKAEQYMKCPALNNNFIILISGSSSNSYPFY